MKFTANTYLKEMARFFLDTNYFIDVVEGRREIDLNQFQNQSLYVSPLSLHILFYVYKYKIPNRNLAELEKYFSFVPLDGEVIKKSLRGPTPDLEDNLQLHSAVAGDCNLFLTLDKKLCQLGFFGKTRIAPNP